MRTPDTLAERIVTPIEESPTLRRLSQSASEALDGLAPAEDSWLRGAPLGHSVHPVLTDLPLGCWLSASLLDLFGGPSSRRSADLLVTVGIASAVPTALTGHADWTTLTKGDLSVGTVHAAGNEVALVLFLLSLRSRRKGRRRSGTMLALAGNLAAAGSGFLGSHLALSRGTADRT